MKTIERGQAGMKIELSNGNITIFHGETGDILAELKNAPDGTWSAMWAGFKSLGFVLKSTRN